ncbi:ABC transporter substrate-binding protein [Hoeflea prorocentri]|uniref:ABC transporter substrate-binding protein n=1 Tax=Hoeflea prorocentri TaxID=1922333 RepID=A0A9X3ZGM4_9HYPH|nr:ABC transporter substrate-binding protein [Hoeflea prorocentri]MCY6380053.1 ABC transporter substrate-binding protein [Hoeflea prorocentri]MDA5397853.1 ABC transporter substrate-binding protein [Hoeflea prorocentri]
MKKLIASSLFATGMMFFANAASAEECGTVTIAEMNWQSAEVLANVDQIILSEGYGCDAEMVPGDTMPTFTSMNEKGQPDVAPELWINAFRDAVDAAVKEGRLHIAAESLADGGVEGWWVPNYIVEAYPEIKTINDALARPDLFPDPEDPDKGGVYNCPSGWNCQISTGNLFKAYEAEDKGFQLVDTGSAAGLDGSIAKAFSRNQGWLGYYWAPTAILGKYEMVRLGFGVPHSKEEWDNCTSQLDCENPKPNAWPKSEVYTVVTDEFQKRGGTAYNYLSNRSWSNKTVNGLLAWMVENQATGEEGARYFLENQEEIWTKWVTPEAAEKVKNYLANS